jgi:hypothetical protein
MKHRQYPNPAAATQETQACLRGFLCLDGVQFYHRDDNLGLQL